MPDPVTRVEPLAILVVDDNADHRFLTQRALRALSDVQLDVRAAEDGDRALAALRASRFDLVLLDVKMPGKDGFDVLRAVRADPALAPLVVVMLSSSENRSDVDRATELGADGYVTKPMDPQRFRDVVCDTVRSFAATVRERRAR